MLRERQGAYSPGQVISRAVLMTYKEVLGTRGVSGSCRFHWSTGGLLTEITSREDPRWGCHPFSWPTSLPLITHSNLSNPPAPLLLLSQPCNYCVRFGLAEVEDTRLTVCRILHTVWTPYCEQLWKEPGMEGVMRMTP